jgi:NAD(P)-dependent dehydrogenase (short-subunit alcohol dehydrogenase family)
MPDPLLADKVVVVVGASTGIGADTARVLAADGAALMLVARTEATLRELADELTATGADVAYTTGDVSQPADVVGFVDATVARFGRLDGAVNLAATTHGGRLDAVPEEEFDRIVAVNLKGTWLCLREEVRVMEAQGSGAIVNFSSIGGLRGSSGFGAYQATKHGVIGLTRTAAHDFGPLGIRVNAIAPGEIDTAILSPGTEKLVESIPMRRLGAPEEVAKAIYYLCTDQSSYVTGAELHINGGQHV